MEKQIVATIKKIIPAVVSIIISKNLTALENPFHIQASDLKTLTVAPKKIKTGGGSGFIVNSSGIILTNRHVVSDIGAEYTVILNNETKYPAKVLAKDPINDIAASARRRCNCKSR